MNKDDTAQEESESRSIMQRLLDAGKRFYDSHTLGTYPSDEEAMAYDPDEDGLDE